MTVDLLLSAHSNACAYFDTRKKQNVKQVRSFGVGGIRGGGHTYRKKQNAKQVW